MICQLSRSALAVFSAAAICILPPGSSSARAAMIEISNPVVTGVLGTDYAFYTVDNSNPTLLDTDATVPISLTTILAGQAAPANSGAPGDNIGLFYNSFNDPQNKFKYPDPLNPNGNLAAQPRTVLSGTLNGHPISISSLNGNDMFKTAANTYSTAYGAPNLANQWFNDFLNAYNFNAALGSLPPALAAAAKQDLFGQFLADDGFLHLMNPNVSYVNYDTDANLIRIGLPAIYDFSPSIKFTLGQVEQSLLLPANTLQSLVPPNVHFSNIALVNGQPMYNFSATLSGLSVPDQATSTTSSYSGNYELTIAPEPGTLSLTACGIVGLVGLRWTRKRKRPA